ncbi:glyoxalase/bleomycin resistance/dioxygenase family protein [Streptomyces sp. MNU77]|uniref:VOC family protein n=1 Tax=Streptomyces sp. MNU77 TaxID=1573406 RepID=UPI0005E7A3AB|nr:VOC family protein [Streptomyces sp. MNU77]OLO25819.1 glyoxalase/bleomycin resistance/dioxygenase family protein [Streptomyces sp. MNU77]
MAGSGEIRNVLYPTEDVDAAVAFYGRALGLAVKFRDGGRYAALDGGGVTLALAGSDEDVTDGGVAASFMVERVRDTVEHLLDAGAALVRGPETGPHETRAVLRDPWGNLLVVYTPDP